MIKFQGRSSLKQYMPMKLIKRDIKVWFRADSRNGYFSLFEVYTGKKKGAVEHQLGARVVKDLTKELQGKWHHAYFFTSYSYSVIWKRVGSMNVGQPERIDVVFQRSSRQQNTNAFILYRGCSGATEISIKQFRIQLAKELIGGYCSRYRAGIMAL